jgi:hypothetical protein
MKFNIYFVFSILLLWSGCKQDSPEKLTILPGKISGQVEVLNACGHPRAARELRVYLMDHGFDVFDIGNADQWNYRKTIIALYNRHWEGLEHLQRVLGTDNVIHLENPVKTVDASIYIGKDFEEVIGNEANKTIVRRTPAY